MKCKILVIAHGDLAESMVRASELVIGRVDGLSYLNLPTDADMDEYSAGLRSIIEQNAESGILILTDFLGGSPFMRAAQSVCGNLDKKVELVTGCNLPMLTEAASRIEEDAAELREIALSAGTQGIADVRARLKGGTGV